MARPPTSPTARRPSKWRAAYPDSVTARNAKGPQRARAAPSAASNCQPYQVVSRTLSGGASLARADGALTRHAASVNGTTRIIVLFPPDDVGSYLTLERASRARKPIALKPIVS